MIQAIELLRNLAGVLFWGLTDVALGVIWLTIILSLLTGIIKSIIKRTKRND